MPRFPRGGEPEEFRHGAQQFGTLEGFGERPVCAEREGALGVEVVPGIEQTRYRDYRNPGMVPIQFRDDAAPLVPGMCRSVTTTAGTADFTAARPAVPSAAARTP